MYNESYLLNENRFKLTMYYHGLTFKILDTNSKYTMFIYWYNAETDYIGIDKWCGGFYGPATASTHNIKIFEYKGNPNFEKYLQ